MQRLKYAARFRNFSISTETDSARLLNMSMFQFKLDHRLAVVIEILKNIHVKYVKYFHQEYSAYKFGTTKLIGLLLFTQIQLTIYRCTLDRFHCENFQVWKITDNIKNFVYMKNQMWSPTIASLNPKIDFPVMKPVRHLRINTDLLTIRKGLWRPYV